MSIEKESLRIEDYESNIKEKMNQIADLVISHPEIPDEYDQGELVAVIQQVGLELKQTLENKVPEINRLQNEIDKQKKQIEKLKDTNQQLYLKSTTVQQRDIEPEVKEPPKPDWEEIKAFMRKNMHTR